MSARLRVGSPQKRRASRAMVVGGWKQDKEEIDYRMKIVDDRAWELHTTRDRDFTTISTKSSATTDTRYRLCAPGSPTSR